MTMRLLRGLSGRVLPCGCLVGVYETYDAEVVATIDARGRDCGVSAHRKHAAVPIESLEDHESLTAGRSDPKP